ncbi:Protein SDA1 [Phlyctochytrium bullatum]|nr:Protein SDA1 [Phlyctochytrium bullatum]
MGKRSRAEFLASNLPQLQNLIRRDPSSYKDEFMMQWRQWETAMKIFSFKPDEEAIEFGELITFLSHIAYCYPKETKEFPTQLMELLKKHHSVLAPSLRKSMVQALILLRNKNVIESMTLMPLFFQLFRVKDKELRKLLHSHIVSDIKNSNAKAKNNRMNKTLQNYMYKMLHDPVEIAAKKSLDVMVDLYNKNVWNDAKTVNVISEACFSDRPKIVATAIRFFLDTNDSKDKDDDDDDAPDINAMKHRQQINKKRSSRKGEVEKALAAVKRKERQKARAEVFNFSALHLINDPQGFAERLFQRLKNATANTSLRFELRLQIMNLCTRLIGVHKLILLPFYEFVVPYLKPHQREVPTILACVAQASHELVPPDAMSTVVQAIADNFVWSNAAAEVVTAGLNALREVCARCPLAMSDVLLQSLIDDYKNNTDKASMNAARALLGLYREINPMLLKKKDRGKGVTINLKDFKAPRYGEVAVQEIIEGADLLLAKPKSDDEEDSDFDDSDDDEEEDSDEEEAPELADEVSKSKGKKEQKASKKAAAAEEDGPGDGWEGWEEASLDSDDEEEEEEGDGEWEDIGSGEEVEGDEGSEEEEVVEITASKGKAKEKAKSAKSAKAEPEESEEEDEGEDEEEEDEEEGGDDEEAFEDAEDAEDGEDDDDDEAEENDTFKDAPDSTEPKRKKVRFPTPGKHLIGPKQAKYMEKMGRTADTTEKDAETAAAAKALATTKIFTDEEFEQMRELAAQRKAEKMVGARPGSFAVNDSDDDSDGAGDPTFVDPSKITAGVKRKMTYEERMESIQAGREGRDKFGSKKGLKKQEKGASTTNREKSKKNKNIMMMVHKKTIKGKAKRSLREKQKILRAHISKQKRKGH